MKRFLILSILLINLALGFSQKITLNEYADKENLTSVVISKSMLSLFPKNSDLSYGGVNVGDFLDKLSSINIFVSPKGETTNKLISFATDLMETPDYDMLMSVKTEKGEDANFYIRGTEENISELVLIVQSKSKESAVMQFLGNFTMEDIQQMIEKATK